MVKEGYVVHFIDCCRHDEVRVCQGEWFEMFPPHFPYDVKAILLNQLYPGLHDVFVLFSSGSLGLDQGHQALFLFVHHYCRVDVLRYEVGPVV